MASCARKGIRGIVYFDVLHHHSLIVATIVMLLSIR